jgi:uncharacterized alkaline shock family protein YloU
VNDVMSDGAVTLPAPEERGRLVIRDAVVQTVVRRAAATASDTHRVSGLTRLIDSDLPHVNVSVHGDRVEAELTVGAQWPTPVGDLAERVRAAVVREVFDHTGLTVTRVQVEVRCIARDDSPIRRVQ